ncbi:MAG: ABC transporter permease [Pseudobdellovibrionaceae bacterium]
MSPLFLSIAAIRNRPLHASLCVAATAAAITLLTCLFLLSNGLAKGFDRSAQGVDLIAGVKASPLQLIFSTLYGVDVPAGNIEMTDYEALAKNKHIRQAIPLALGDSYKGFRMVGTTAAYPALYQAETAEGRMFENPFETVVGARTGLKIGEEFAVTHGFSADGDDVHRAHLYKVTGILKPTGTVLDRLLLTPLQSVQQLHSHVDAHDSSEEQAEEAALAHQVTAVLLQVRSRTDLFNLPRTLNATEPYMVVRPSYEMARFSRSLGLGKTLTLVLAAGFFILAGLILLSTLASSLSLRRYDLAILRVLGASRGNLFLTVLSEGVLLSGMGAIIGLLIGHALAFTAVTQFDFLRGLILPSSMLYPTFDDLAFLGLGIGAGVLASLIPAISSAKADIADILAQGRG